jgi:hypothetical protein
VIYCLLFKKKNWRGSFNIVWMLRENVCTTKEDKEMKYRKITPRY